MARSSGSTTHSLSAATPEVLFLDEPTVGLDVEARHRFIDSIRDFAAAGRTLVLTTHILEEADELAARIVVIDRGVVIADGTPTEIKSKVGGKRVKLRLPRPLTEADFASLPVTGLEISGDRVRLLSNDADRALTSLIRNGLDVRDLEVVGAGLEGVLEPDRSSRRRVRRGLSVVAAAAATEGDLAPLPRVLWTQFTGQLIATLRVPAFWVASLILPVMFFTFFGLPNAHFKYSATVSFGAYILASYGAYAVTSVMMFSFGIGVATERAGKVDLLLRASPLPPAIYLLAKILNAVCFALASIAILFVFGAVTGGVSETAATWAGMVVKLLLGSLPFLLLGFAIGYFFTPNAAPAVVNLVFFPMSFASGVFVPLQFLPKFVRDIAPFLPTYHLAQLAWGSIGVQSESAWTSTFWLLGYAAAFFAFTLYAYRRDETSKFR